MRDLLRVQDADRERSTRACTGTGHCTKVVLIMRAARETLASTTSVASSPEEGAPSMVANA